MLEANQMKVLSKTVSKTKIDRIRNQQISESCSTQLVIDWVEWRRREWENR